MKKRHLSLILSAALLLPGCGDQTNLEEQQMTLLLGLDVGKGDELKFYSVSPVFSPEASQKYNITGTYANTARQARKRLDAMSIGSLVGGKVQNIVISKKLLQKKNAFVYLDSFFRDPKNEINGVVMVVDGEVKNIVYMNMKDKGRPGVVLKEQVETSYEGRSTVRTTLQQYHRQMLEPGVTPYLTQIKPGSNEIIITGTAFLNHEGKYVTSVGLKESSLFLLMKKQLQRSIPVSFLLPPDILEDKKQKQVYRINLNIGSAKRKIMTKVQQGTFHFDIKLDIGVVVTERPFKFDSEKKGKQFKKAVEIAVKKDCEKILHKFQQHQIDPVGLGQYVQAFHYKEWKKVEKDWGKAFSKAKVTVTPKVKIMSYGVEK